MKAALVVLAAKLQLVAYVFQGDEEDSGRIWVCVRSEDVSARPGWLGCWSKKNVSNSAEIKDLLVDLQEKVAERVKVGPSGPWLGGTYFFSEWDSWGPGIPAPILNINVAEVAAGVSGKVAVSDFRFECS